MRRLALALVLCDLGCQPPPPAVTPGGAAAAAVEPAATPKDPMPARLAALDEAIDRERVRLGVPGAAIVIVKDGKVIHTRGWGTRAVASDAPVGADTLFAIGSTTKAFTAMLAMMAVEAGKLSLDAHPSTCLPGFAIRGEGNATITVRDLMTHTSGLPTADLAWSTGSMTSDELIALLGEIEPVAGVRKAFHYQNLAYLAAGQCAARALGGEYEALLRARILDRVGMGDATLRIAQMQARADAAHGHHRGADGRTREVPMRTLDAVAPAGAINASAAMLGGWLTALVAHGVVDGKPLLARAQFDELLRPQFSAGPGIDYALGWLRARAGKDWYYSHTGGIDGFTALVGVVPERGLGFAFLNNVDHADLHGVVAHEVLALLEDAPPPPGKPEVPSVDEVGTYGLLGGFKVEVVRDGERIAVVVAGQPKYPLVFEEGRRYRLGGAAPAGFGATFRPTAADPKRTEMLLVQPFGNLVLPRLSAAELAAAATATPSADIRELLGVYRPAGAKDDASFEIAAVEGQGALIVPGQTPAPLMRTGVDHYGLAGLPDVFWIEPLRAAAGKLVTGLRLHKPDGDLELTLVASSAPPPIAIETVLRKRAAAHGSAKLAKHTSLRIESALTFVHQGLRGRSVTLRAAGDRWADDVRLLGAGREIGRVRLGFDGAPWQRVSFAADQELEPLGAQAIALDAPFDAMGPVAKEFSSAAVWRSGTVGKRPVVVVRFTTEWGAVVLDSYDAKSFLLLRRELDLPSDADGGRTRETRMYSDYRRIAGVMIPHVVEVESVQGKVVARVTKVAFDEVLPTDAFAAPR
jgi:CubicO group peptidase (beta-lactamase class C family)